MICRLRHIINFILIFSGISRVVAQGIPSDFWHRGMLILNKGDTLKGLLKYNFDEEVVQFLSNERVSIFTPKNTASIIFTDTLTEGQRYFLSCEHILPNELTAKNFFEYETMYKGKLVLSREQVMYTGASSISSMGFGGDKRSLRYYYFLFKDGKLEKIDANKRSVNALFHDKTDEIHSHIKEHKLKVYNKKDFIHLFEYYNTLK